mmetsp:Transcript_6673/g.5798  ORF Transcript_6673/g.5798 Transcript_6673/m.5798 type:complete len:86 (+) Transcript_6673:170-427(+)
MKLIEAEGYLGELNDQINSRDMLVTTLKDEINHLKISYDIKLKDKEHEYLDILEDKEIKFSEDKAELQRSIDKLTQNCETIDLLN